MFASFSLLAFWIVVLKPLSQLSLSVHLVIFYYRNNRKLKYKHSRKDNGSPQRKGLYIDKHKGQNVTLKLNLFV